MPALPANFTIEDHADGTATVRDVPIFAVCEKEGFTFDESWIDEAIQYHQAQEANKGASPAHVGHHGEPVEVKPAGAWINTRKAQIRGKRGEVKPGVIVDLLLTNADAVARAKRGELLWRSPEIPLAAAQRKAQPRFRSLALLDRNAPHNDDLPVLTVKPGGVSFENPASQSATWTLQDAGPVLAFSAHGESIIALMEPEAVTEPAVTPSKPAKMRMRFNASVGTLTNLDTNEVVSLKAGVGESDTLRFESEGGEGPAGLLERVKGLTAEDLATFRKGLAVFLAEIGASSGAPITNQLGDVGGPQMSDTNPTITPPATPKVDPEVVRLASEVETLKAKGAARERADALNAAADAAMVTLKGRTLPADQRARFLAFGEKYGADAIKFHADELAKALPSSTASFIETIDGGARGPQAVPDEVLKFQDKGADAYEGAIRSWRRYEQVKAAGHTDLSLTRWLEVQSTAGFSRGSVKQEV